MRACLSPSSREPELHPLTVTAAKAAFDLRIPNKPLLVGRSEVQQSTSPRWPLYRLGEEVVADALQEPPRLLMPRCVVPPANTVRTRACEREAAPVCL